MQVLEARLQGYSKGFRKMRELRAIGSRFEIHYPPAAATNDNRGSTITYEVVDHVLVGMLPQSKTISTAEEIKAIAIKWTHT